MMTDMAHDVIGVLHKEPSGDTADTATAAATMATAGANEEGNWALFGEPVKKETATVMRAVQELVTTVGNRQLDANVRYPSTSLPATLRVAEAPSVTKSRLTMTLSATSIGKSMIHNRAT